MEIKTIKFKLEIENKEEVEQWINSLINKLEKANSLADELAKKNQVDISIHLDGKEIARAVAEANHDKEGTAGRG